MKRVALTAAILLATLSPSWSAVIAVPEDADAVTVPDNSPLHFRGFGPEHALEFDGAIALSGTWYYGDNQFNDGGAPDPTLYFVPDKASFARLPTFKTRGQPTNIYLTNPGDFLDRVISKDDRAKAEKKGGKYLSGRIDIWIDKFEAGIECDAPFFNAHFLRIAAPPQRIALGGMPDAGC